MTDDTLMRESQFRYTLVVDGEDLGLWDKADGGKVTSSDDEYRAGGMAPAEALGGDQSKEVVTLTRACRTLRDQAADRKLETKPGNGRAVVTGQWLDRKRVAFGTPKVINGLVTAYDGPKHDSQSNAPAMMVIEIKPDGVPV